MRSLYPLYDKKIKQKESDLMYNERINFICKADYRKDKVLYITVFNIIGKISYGDKLRKQSIRDYNGARGVCEKKHREEQSVDVKNNS